MGKELDKVFYNDVYKDGGSGKLYFKHYTETPWVPVWTEVLNLIHEYGFKKILDIGCGPGQFSKFVKDHSDSIEYTGLDFSNEAISMALDRTPDYTFICGNAYEFNYNDIDYDAIVTMEFLEHIEGDLDVLSKINTGTIIFATLPNMDSEGHVRYLSKDESIAKSEIIERYSDICKILKIQYFPYKSNPTNADYLIIMEKL